MKLSLASAVTERLFGAEGDIASNSQVQVVILASAVLVMGSTLVSPIITGLSTVYGVSEAVAGWLNISYLVVATVCIPVAGWLADKFGRRAVLAPGLALYGTGGALVGVSDAFAVALVFRSVQAVGFAAAIPVTVTIFGDLYSGDREATGQGLRSAGINVAIMIVPFVAGVLFSFTWRAPFVLFLLAVPLAALSWSILPEFDEQSTETPSTYVADLAELCKELTVAFLLALFFMRFFLLYGFYTYVSVLLIQEVGMGVVLAGAVVSIKGLFSILISSQAGRLSGIFDQYYILIVGFMMTGVGFVLLGSVPTMAAAVLATALFGIGDGTIAPTQKSLLTRLAPSQLRNGAISIATTLQNVGKVAGPIVLGGLITLLPTTMAFAGFGAASTLLSLVLLVAATASRV
jgi:MFS family permease